MIRRLPSLKSYLRLVTTNAYLKVCTFDTNFVFVRDNKMAFLVCCNLKGFPRFIESGTGVNYFLVFRHNYASIMWCFFTVYLVHVFNISANSCY